MKVVKFEIVLKIVREKLWNYNRNPKILQSSKNSLALKCSNHLI